MSEFIIIVESEADFRIASAIANRVLCEQIEWLEDYLSTTVNWCGLQAHTDFSCWRDIEKIRGEAMSQGTHLPRFIGGKVSGADGASARKILQLIKQLQRKRSITAVVFIRDLDSQAERRSSLEQARDLEKSADLAIVIGTADSKREAWVLNGFLPLDEIEHSALEALHQELTFDPTVESHRLREITFQEPQRSRNVKVVLSTLTNNNHERESKCWMVTSLSLLRERGIHSGLTDYITEVQERLVPLLR